MSESIRRGFVIGMACAAMGMAAPSAGQEAPSTKAIIDALKPMTRSSRNLIVVDRAETPASAAKSAETSRPPGETPPTEALQLAAKPNISMAIRFDFDSWRIKPESAEALENLAAALASPELRASRFLLEGHTDATGGAAYNQRLSQQRADEVKRYLTERGVAPERVASVGRGATQLVNVKDPGSAENRRVRLVNLD
ncbi:MAG TPA: OmpA family protein [Caldimonas sp.]|nr:OmpA family protein [Caldimonas sp.]